MTVACQIAQWILRSEFVRSAPRFGGTWARAHARRCRQCGEQYDALASFERAAFGHAGLSDRAVGRVESDILRDLGRRSPSRLRPLMVAAGVACAAGVVAAIGATRLATKDDRYQPRRSTATALHVRLFCLAADGAVLASAGPGQSLSCPRSGLIQTSYSAARPGYLSVVGVDAHGEAHWYHGPRSGPPALPVAASAAEVVLPGSIRLAANHHPGQIEVRAYLLDDAPVTADAAGLPAPTGTDEDPPPVLLTVTPD